MAKGNLFLGTAARSVGDVVMYRREGAQVSRVRVRKIANPKTDAQCLQRAFMSACVKFYQPLANVLDRSWQGKSRAKSYAAFLKANAPKVRAAGYYLNKGTGFFPLPLQLSNGTLPIQNAGVTGGDMAWPVAGVTQSTTDPQTIGDLSTILTAGGHVAGDVVTVIIVLKTSNGDYIPSSYQFVIDTTDTTELDGFIPTVGIMKEPSVPGIIFHSANTDLVAGAIIIARNVDGVWQRSKEVLAVDSTILATITTDAAKSACIESYKGAAASDNPLVYLDGDELENA